MVVVGRCGVGGRVQVAGQAARGSRGSYLMPALPVDLTARSCLLRTPLLQLWEGLSALGLKPFVEKPEDRLVTVNTIKVRSGGRWGAAAAWAGRR